MVKLEHISTPPKNTTETCYNTTTINSPTSSSSDQPSPTSPLPPSIEITIMPPLLPHHHYPSQSNIILYSPPPPQHPPMVYYHSYPPHPSYFHPPTFYHPPPPSQYQPQQPNPVFNYPQVTPPQNPHPQTTPREYGLMNPIIRGPRADNQVSEFRSGFGSWTKKVYGSKTKNDQKSVKYCNNGDRQGNKAWVKREWKPKVKIMGKNKKVEEKNPNSSFPNTPVSYPAELANCTTIMLKNIPNTIRRSRLMELLDRHCQEQNASKDKDDDDGDSCQSQYNFLYLPFDFVHEQNLGYAFVNFTTTEGALALYTCWNNKGWNLSPKIRNITPAKLQGLAQCRGNFQGSKFVCKSEEYLPVEFTPPRNGFNGDTCKAKNIGTWVKVNASHPRKSSGKKRFVG